MQAKSRAIALVDELEAEYRRSVGALRTALRAFLARGVAPDPAVQPNVALLPVRVEPGVGVVRTPAAPAALNAV